MHRILVVDDDQAVGHSMLSLLEAVGYSVRLVDSGHAALDYLAREGSEFSAVITDLHMTGMDGLTLARHVSERFPGIPVILCSGSGETAPEHFGMRPGLSTVLAKPIRRRQLAQVLAQLIPN